MAFLNVDTGTVAAAGRQTAATSSQWQTWAVQAEERLRAGPGAAHDDTVESAAAEYLGDWNQKLHRVAAQVDALGTNTSSAATVVDNADTESDGFLRAFATNDATVGSLLNRHIDA
jgi:hypothetical protein